MHPLAPTLLGALLLAGLAFGCAAPPSLQGTWRSHRSLTLEELAAAPDIDPGQRAVLERPDFFGELVLEIDATHITTILPYHRAADPYRVLSREGDSLLLESTDAGSGERQVVRCRFRDGQLLVPVPELGFHEVFVRVTEKQ